MHIAEQIPSKAAASVYSLPPCEVLACGGGGGGGSVSENRAAVVSSRPSRAPLSEVIRASLSVAEGTDGATEDFLERPW